MNLLSYGFAPSDPGYDEKDVEKIIMIKNMNKKQAPSDTRSYPMCILGRYNTFEQLQEKEIQGIDYQIVWQNGGSGFAIMAHHGGGIEPGTTEIARAVAGADHSFYSFMGLKKKGNLDLHITSRQFDEPTGTGIANNSKTILTIHGCKKKEEAVYIGGRDIILKEKLKESLKNAGFSVMEDTRFPGVNPKNICNRSSLGKGVQLEITAGLRNAMFKGLMVLNRKGPTMRFYQFVKAVRNALSEYRRTESKYENERL